ncbi:MAG: PQQ-binding-like beta-propeller repeat protein [Tepidisphaeraceae bacterium]|jgi:outer membrane protein assembly factor BamB
MKKTSRTVAVVAGGVALFVSSWGLAADWPQWRGPNRDAKVSDFKAPQIWPKQLAQKWKVKVGAADATPALVGDKLYVFSRDGADEVISCLDAATGKQVWQDKSPAGATVGGPASGHPGPRSSPAVADGKVVTLGVGGIVSCLDVATGKVIWRNNEYKAVPRFSTAASPIIVDGLCVVPLGGGGNGAVVAFDLATGKEKWKYAGEGPAYASPVLLTADGVKQVVTMLERSVVGISMADGKLLWQLPAQTGGMGFYNAATPVVDGSTVYITGSGSGFKALKIEKKGDAFAATEVWNNADYGTAFNSPVLKDNMLFAIDSSGKFFCVDAKDGKTLWSGAAVAAAGAAPAGGGMGGGGMGGRGGGMGRGGNNYGALIDAGSVIIALPPNSELIAFKPDGKQYTEVARIKVAETPTFAFPVIAGSQVFVKDADSVAAYAFE